MISKSINSSKNTKRKRRTRIIKLRGYIEQKSDNNYFGVCLDLNLHVHGKSLQETHLKLNQLIKWYIKDAIKNKEIAKFIPRRAPARLYLKYYKFKCIFLIIFHIHKFFETFQIQEECEYA